MSFVLVLLFGAKPWRNTIWNSGATLTADTLDAAGLRIIFPNEDPKSGKAPALSAGWKKFPIDSEQGNLAIDVSDRPDKTVIVALDTGACDGISLRSQEWQNWASAHPDPPATISATTTPGMTSDVLVEEEFWADDLSIGLLHISDVPVKKGLHALESTASSDHPEATLGLTALKHFEIMVDGANGWVYLKPRTGPLPPYKHNRAGAFFVPQINPNKKLTAHVARNSPAYEAGIRDGDVLVSIDGKKAEETQIMRPEVAYSDQPAGTKLKMTLQRSGSTYNTTVVLRDILGPSRKTNPLAPP